MKLAARDAASRTQIGTGPSMTPMVDVVLVILVFFMASAAFLTPEWLLSVALPEKTGQQGETDPFAMPTPRFVVRLDAGPSGEAIVTGLGLEGAPIASLGPRIESLLGTVPSEDLVLILEPSDSVAYEAVVLARETAEAAGASQVALR